MTPNNTITDALIILDGWGINPDKRGNAVSLAHTPFLDKLEADFPCSHLSCHGNAVGLPDGIMGNSEVGHMNIGAGRKVYQDLVRINESIKDKSFFKNPELVQAMAAIASTGSSLHLMGLLSDGGVHSHITHVFALIDMAIQLNIKKIFVHPILDGRDTPPKSGIEYIKDLQAHLTNSGTGKIASLCGRFYAMDRDTRWDRVKQAYELYTQGTGSIKTDPVAAMQEAYESGQTDEFIQPVSITDNPGSQDGLVRDNDALIFFNFRADRAREITRAFTQKSFEAFTRDTVPELSSYLCMTLYDETFTLPVAFGPQHLDNILGEVLAQNSLSQLRIAETEKYAHVTYFFNGGDEKVFPGEERILIPSPREVRTYDQKPEMSAPQVADKACEIIRRNPPRFMVLNFANMDMVGHTGIIEAAVKACETVDRCAQQVVEAIWETGGTAMVTADHGNAELMMQEDGTPHTAHTLNPVRFIVAGKQYTGIKTRNGILGDIAPTVLKIMGIKQPVEMTGTPLF